MYNSGKLIVSGAIFEFFLYEDDVWRALEEQGQVRRRGRMKSAERRELKIKIERTEDEIKDLRALAGLRSARNLRRLINANSGQWYPEGSKIPYRPVFFTLTFARNQQDVDEANLIFKKFILRFNYAIFSRKYSGLKYVSVIEFQKRGAVHFHVIFFNLPFVPDLAALVSSIWGQGFVRIKAVDEIENLGSYVVKYMSKDFQNSKVSKLYQASKGLKRSVLIKSDYTIGEFLSLLNFEDGKYFQKDLESVYVGKFRYIRVNVDDHALGILKQVVAQRRGLELSPPPPLVWSARFVILLGMEPSSTIDFSQVNFVTTCEVDYSYNVSGTLMAKFQQCYSPFQTFWVLYALIVLGAYACYRVMCLYKH